MKKNINKQEFKDYHSKIVKEIVEINDQFKDMKDDPVVDLLLTALSYQAYKIEENIEEYENDTVSKLLDSIIPYHLVRPVPAFSILETALKDSSEAKIDEKCSFVFEKNKEEYSFSPLLTTKIIKGECEVTDSSSNSITVELKMYQNIKDLSGISFYFKSQKLPEIKTITVIGAKQALPLIKPNQYNELPFTKMFNNHHLLMKENQYLFGTYDYWQKIFLTNTTNLYYIGKCNQKNLSDENQQNIKLEIIFEENLKEKINEVKINCIPIVQVVKKEKITLKENDKEIAEFKTEGKEEFLHLLIPEKEENIEEYTKFFYIRQFGIERYNLKMLLQQLKKIKDHYISDYYAFQKVEVIKEFNEFKKNIENFITTLKEKLKENNGDIENKVNNYYAILKKDTNDKGKVIEYLTTFGSNANNISETTEDKIKINEVSFLDKKKTKLLFPTQGGQDSINDSQKEDIAKYYFLTKDRLVTVADIRAFCYKEFNIYKNPDDNKSDLKNIKIENIDIEKIDKKTNTRNINITLNEELNKQDFQNFTTILERKLPLYTNNNIKFNVKFV